MQILNYLYTGVLSYENNNFASALLIKVVKTAKIFNLEELVQLCLFDLSQMMNENNVIRIFKEAFDERKNLGIILDLCYQVILENFTIISRSVDFCSLDQRLMHQVIKNVVPQLDEIKNSIEKDNKCNDFFLNKIS